MDELRVPKRRVPAEALLGKDPARRVTLFLSDGAAEHAGPERPDDILNGGDDFVPAFDEETGMMSFLNRAAVEALRVPHPPGGGAGEEIALATEHEVEVTLRGGSSLVGLVSYVRPTVRARLVDFLNDPEPFFRLIENGADTYVNKRHVLRITLRKS